MITNKTLTKEQMEAIDNYGSRIKTLKDFITSVRTRPTMYLGSLFNKGLLNAMREVFQNDCDSILDPLSPADWCSFYYDERTKEVITEDNGTGIPASDIIRVLTSQHTSKNYEKKPGEYSSGYNGVGAKIVNALSSTYIVESYKYDGTAYRMEFSNGYPATKEPKSIPNKEKKQGFKTYFIMDESIMGEMNLEWRAPYHLIKHIISLMPLGTRCSFTAIDINGKIHTEEIVNKDGIITDLIMKVKHPLIKPIVIPVVDDGYHKLECALCFDAGDDTPTPEPSITSFCNMCPTITEGSTHVEGVLDGICRWFMSYMNNIYLINQKSKDKLKIISNDIKNGLNIMISAAVLEPLFNDQAKTVLGNPDMALFCKDVVMKGLDTWSKTNPQDLVKLCKFFKDMGELRVKQDKDKVKIVQKYSSSVATGGLPKKYVRPLGKEHIELIIVEGDSAMGNVETGRNKYTQGVFPIRGKIINAFKCSKNTFFNNEEVQALNKIILGTEYKRNFKIEDCKVEKVIFMSDADVDGAHISALLLRMFVMYYPQMIEAGMVYKAIPPLYSIKVGNKFKYFTEQIDIVRYIQKSFLQKYQMTLPNSKEPLSNKEVTLFFMKNSDYIYYLEKIANTYAVDPNLLELILYHYISNKNKIVFDKLKKEVKSAYRFMDAYNEKGTIIVKGTIAKSNVVILNPKFFLDCHNILDIMRNNDSLYYNINGKRSTIYQVMCAYNSVSPSGIKRYKGLGEMSKDTLAESTLLSTGERTLIRYTMDDAKECLEAIREYESDTKKILKLVTDVSREDLMD